jgi:ATP:corrinoid adenosyltransferase
VDELRDLVIKRGETDIVMTGITMNDEIYTFADEVTKVETTKFRKF